MNKSEKLRTWPNFFSTSKLKEAEKGVPRKQC
jgi:hypothetical protein